MTANATIAETEAEEVEAATASAAIPIADKDQTPALLHPGVVGVKTTILTDRLAPLTRGLHPDATTTALPLAALHLTTTARNPAPGRQKEDVAVEILPH